MLSPLWDEHQLLAFNLVPTTWQVWFVNSRRVLIADLRAARWIRGGLWTLAVLWGTSLFTLFALFTPKYYNAVTVGFTGYPEGCQPNDAFSIDPSGYNPFAIDDYFQINIGFGELSFTQAKVIDMAWDVVSVPGVFSSGALLTAFTDRRPGWAGGTRLLYLEVFCDPRQIFDAQTASNIRYLLDGLHGRPAFVLGNPPIHPRRHHQENRAGKGYHSILRRCNAPRSRLSYHGERYDWVSGKQRSLRHG